MIELTAVSKIYQMGDQSLKALDNVSMTINKGDYISVMGPSGSGKSTLLNMIGLLDRPDKGQLLINGMNTTQLDEESRAAIRRDNIGFIFQSFQLIPRLSAFENIEVPLLLVGQSKSERRNNVLELMEQLGIADRADHLPKQLSGGQLQRVAIARALILEPEILLADEPTGNLDSRSGADVIELLESLNKNNITLMIVTHDLDIGARAPRKVQIIDGRINEVEKHHAFG